MKKLFLVIPILALAIITVYGSTSFSQLEKVDLVIFSYNRPLQLYALLESVQKYCTGIGEIHVIYRAGNQAFGEGYAIVQHDFSDINYHRQGNNPQLDFKPLTVAATFESPSPYVIFAVDDIVVKDFIDFAVCAQALERYNAYGFYLRLGMNLTNCYSYGSAWQPLPPLNKEESQEIVSWCFNEGTLDWKYPHTVDMTVYRKKDIELDLRMLTYHVPNRLEDVWNQRAGAIILRKGLCFCASKIVNMPLNRVQHEYNNRAMHEWSPQALLNELLGGKKMDIAPLKCVNNSAAHMEYCPTFMSR